MTRLTPHAKQTLETLADKHLALTIARATIEAELKKELAERLVNFKAERDIALRLAAEAGVPRTQLGKTIGTSNYKTVQDILACTEDVVARHESEDSKWAIVGLPNGNYNLTIQNLGVSRITGEAEVSITQDDIDYVSGDEFVIPALYRDGSAQDVIASVN